jgi:predicted HAD superfamily Cof-like phosphohydrolase
MYEMTPQEMLEEFHLAAGNLGRGGFTGSAELRQRLLDEEVQELRDAIVAGDLAEIADALADIVYVAIGTAVFYKIPWDEVFAEVHRSNMTKFRDGIVRPDGKIIKGMHYEAPRIAGILEASRASQ